MSNPYKDVNDVIIVDDDKEIQEVLEMYCEYLGIFRNIVKAADGSQASHKINNQKFLITFLDINMPKKTGVDLIKEFKKDGTCPPDNIVIVSGNIDKTVMQASVSSGIKHFLVKPFDQKQFTTKVLEILKGCRPDLVKEAIKNIA